MGCFYVLTPPKRGQTVVVTGATGAVGSTAVQLLKSTGARVVGIAGGPKKNAFLKEELGLDGTVDYKHADRSVDGDPVSFVEYTAVYFKLPVLIIDLNRTGT